MDHIKSSSRNSKVFFGWLVLGFVSFIFIPASANPGPAGLGIQGVLADTNGQPILSTVTFRLQVLDSSETCVLFEEYHTNQNLAASTGVFSLNLGSGSGRVNKIDSSTTLKSNIFRNDVTPLTVTDCTNPLVMSSGLNRKVRITFDAGSGPVTLSPNVTIQSSAYASVAETLQGKAPSDLAILKDDATTDLTQANLESVFSATNFPALMGLIAGTSTSYERAGRLNGGTIPTVGIGESLRWNGTGWDTFVAGGGTIGVASVTAGSGLLGGTITSNGTLSVNTGTSAGQIVQLDGTAKIPTALLPSLSTAMITSGTLGVANGGTGRGTVSPYSILIGNMTGTAYDATTCSTQGMYLEWQASTGFVCVPFSASSVTTGTLGTAFGGLGLNATTAGTGQLLIGNGNNTGFTLAQLTAGTGIQITNGAGSIAISLNGLGAAGPTGPTGDSVWAISGSTINYMAGSVGVGTANPTSAVDIASGNSLVLGAATGGSDRGGRIRFRRPFDGVGNGEIGYILSGTSSVLGINELTGNGEIRMRAVGDSGGFFSIWTNPGGAGAAEAMRVASSGFVGIGNTNPFFSLDVNSALSPTAARLVSTSTSNSQRDTLILRTNNSAPAGGAGIGTGILMHAENSAGSGADIGRIGAALTNATFGSESSQMNFWVTSSGTLNEAVRIDSTGFVGIGTTSPTQLLDVNGAIRVRPSSLPSSPTSGEIAVDSAASNSLKYFNGTVWNTLGVTGGAGGGGTSTSAMTFNSNTDNSASDGGFNFQSNGSNLLTISNAGDVNITSTTPSTSNTTGALTVSGGLGVAGMVNALKLAASATSTSVYAPTGATSVPNGVNGAVIQVKNNSLTDGVGAYQSYQVFNAAGNLQNAYIGAISTTGAGYTPSIVIGQQTGANSYAERMRIDSDGNVGIGTTTPGAALDVNGNVSASGDYSAQTGDSIVYGTALGNPFPSGPRYLAYNQSNTSGASSFFMSRVRNSSLLNQFTYIGATSTNGGATYTPSLVFGVSDSNTTYTERMRIDPTGKVGIGTTTPGSLLEVAGTISARKADSDIAWNLINTDSATARFPTFNVVNYMGSATGGQPGIIVKNARGSQAAVLPTNSGDYLGVVGGAGHNGSTWMSAASIIFEAAETFTGSASGTHMRFVTTAPTTNTASEKMRITGSGNVGIGTTNPLQALSVTGSISATSGVIATRFESTSGNIAWSPLATNNTTAGTDEKRWDIYQDATTLQIRAMNDAFTAGNAAFRAGRTGTTINYVAFPNGSIGIGTTNPSAKLHILSSGANSDIFADTFGVGNATRFTGRFARGNSSSPTQATPDDYLAVFGGTAYHSGGAFPTTSNAAITMRASQSQTGANQGAYMTFETTSTNDQASNRAERMRITADGNVGIGTTSPSGMFHVNGQIMSTGTATSNAPNAIRLDGYNNGGRISALGPNASTKGNFQIEQYSSDGSIGSIAMTIAPTGNVGIGTTAPDERLDLGGGNIKMGWERISNTCTSAVTCTATCTAGKRATGGSCSFSGSWVHHHTNAGDSSYVCNTSGTVDITVSVYCANIR